MVWPDPVPETVNLYDYDPVIVGACGEEILWSGFFITISWFVVCLAFKKQPFLFALIDHLSGLSDITLLS